MTSMFPTTHDIPGTPLCCVILVLAVLIPVFKISVDVAGYRDRRDKHLLNHAPSDMEQHNHYDIDLSFVETAEPSCVDLIIVSFNTSDTGVVKPSSCSISHTMTPGKNIGQDLDYSKISNINIGTFGSTGLFKLNVFFPSLYEKPEHGRTITAYMETEKRKLFFNEVLLPAFRRACQKNL
ncbi:unnamed protein product [Absidia cylindrospora]